MVADTDWLKIAKEYLNGESSVKLGQKYGYHYTTILYHLKKMGIKVRSPAEGIRLARKKWHKQKVLSELSHIVRMLNGSSPSWLYLYKNRPDLLYAMERYFGSLNRAKQALGLKCNQKQKRFHLPSEAKKITPTLGYLFGAYLGDGLKTAERKIEFSCGDEDFARAISRCITDWLGEKTSCDHKE